MSAVKNSAYGPPRSISAPKSASALQNGGDAHAAGRTNGNEPALCLGLVERFRKRGDDAGSGCGKRVAERQTAALDVELGAIDGAEHCRKAQFFLAERGVVPRLEGAQHLSREGLVNLVKIEVLESQARIGEHARHGIRRRHQQALLFLEVIDRSHLPVSQK